MARQAGFDRVGVTTAEPLLEAEAAMRAALDEGRLAALPWMTPERIHLATHPAELFPAARSILVVAMGYLTPSTYPSPTSESFLTRNMEKSKGNCPPLPAGERTRQAFGRLARYAWGEDYHRVLRRKLRWLCRAAAELAGRPLAARICVDTAPLAERALAQRAGLGNQGANCTLIAPGLGSWLVLGEVIWDLELPPDAPAPPAEDLCRGCDQCLRACPTGALVAPYRLDVSRCLSYLTVEGRDDIPPALRSRLGDRFFGCDACQEACPHNAAVPVPGHPEFAPRYGPTLPLSLFLPAPAGTDFRREVDGPLDEAQFAARFGQSSLRRAGLAGMQRNARALYGLA